MYMLQPDEHQIQLGEQQIGFSPVVLGFPSVHGCNAIVYQTHAGIYGYHVAGGSDGIGPTRNATMFRQFVLDHQSKLGDMNRNPCRLYTVTNIATRYGSHKKKAGWLREMVTFAGILHYTGKISGYDVSKIYPESAVYVEYEVIHGKCNVYIRLSPRGETYERVNNPCPDVHKERGGGGVKDLPKVAIGVDRSNLQLVHKTQLR